jgi:hypothetical protein
LSPLKQRAVHLLLVVFTVWPAVQLTLVALYDVNPWKLAGWGMYSAPQIPCYVRVFGITSDEVGVYELQTLQAGLDAELQRFLHLRRSLRRLVRPDRLGRRLLEHYPAIDGIDVVVVQPLLVPQTGMIEERSERYAYRR